MKFSALHPDISKVVGWPQNVDAKMRAMLNIALSEGQGMGRYTRGVGANWLKPLDFHQMSEY